MVKEKARLILLGDGVVRYLLIDTQDLSDEALEHEYGLSVEDTIAFSGDLAVWPTDRAIGEGE